LNYPAFKQGSIDGMRIQQGSYNRVFDLEENFERWSVDQTKGMLVWHMKDGGSVSAPLQIVGTYNPHDKTFLWAWTNPSVQKGLIKHALTAKAFGAKHGIKELTDAKLVGYSVEKAEALGAVVNRICNGAGVYVGNTGGGPFVIMTHGGMQGGLRGKTEGGDAKADAADPSVELDKVGDAKPSASDKKEPKPYGTFYGAPLQGEGVYFVLDMSGSMLRHLEEIRGEFRKAVMRVPDGVFVGAMSYPSDMAKPSRGIKPANAAWRETLAHAVDRKGAGGRSPMHEGLAKALDTIFVEAKEGVKIQTIFLLSDGKADDEEWVERLLADRLKDGQVLHTISMDRTSPFLAKLAATHQGVYRDVGKIRAMRNRAGRK